MLVLAYHLYDVSEGELFYIAIQSFRIEFKFRVKTSTWVHRLLKGSCIIVPVVDRLPVAVNSEGQLALC